MTPLIFATIEELEAAAGTRRGESAPLLVTQALIDAFAETTGDRQWIHIDTERAKRESPFGTTVAHGFLTVSLLPQMIQSALRMPPAPASLNYGFDRLRFVSPVPSGSEIRATFAPAVVRRLGADVEIGWDVEVRVSGAERPAVVARWLSRLVGALQRAT